MSIASDAIDSLNELGFALNNKPTFDIPQLPMDITELDDGGLMELFVQLTMWSDYVAGAFAIAAINEKEAETAVKQYEASGMLANWTGAKADRLAIAKATITASERMQELTRNYDTAYAFRKLLETKTNNIDRDTQLVSRELTRRTADNSGFRSRQRRI